MIDREHQAELLTIRDELEYAMSKIEDVCSEIPDGHANEVLLKSSTMCINDAMSMIDKVL